MKLRIWKDLHYHLLPTLWIRRSCYIFNEPFPGALTFQWLHRGLSIQWMPRSPFADQIGGDR